MLKILEERDAIDLAISAVRESGRLDDSGEFEAFIRGMFHEGWKAGRMYERMYHAAMARGMCGPNGEHGEPGHPTGHDH